MSSTTQNPQEQQQDAQAATNGAQSEQPTKQQNPFHPPLHGPKAGKGPVVNQAPRDENGKETGQALLYTDDSGALRGRHNRQ